MVNGLVAWAIFALALLALFRWKAQWAPVWPVLCFTAKPAEAG
jgi:hypothetical protein